MCVSPCVEICFYFLLNGSISVELLGHMGILH